jgi:hypothetical protein
MTSLDASCRRVHQRRREVVQGRMDALVVVELEGLRRGRTDYVLDSGPRRGNALRPPGFLGPDKKESVSAGPCKPQTV